VLRIDPVTGQQTILTSFGFLSEPDGIAIAPSPVPESSTGVFSVTTLIILSTVYLRRRSQTSRTCGKN
jgi:hypothetical protein